MNPPEHWSSVLAKLGACAKAVKWARTMPDLGTAWSRCERGDWLLWYAVRMAPLGGAEHRAAVRAACACARTALGYVPARENRPRLAIEAAERWAEGRMTIDEVRVAHVAAHAATHAAAAASYTAAEVATANAADAAASAAASAARDAASAATAYAAAAASYAARAAAAADAAAAATAVRRRALAEMADIVRELIPNAPPPPEQSR